MTPFAYLRALDEDAAIDAGRAPGTDFIAGGTTLVDLMRLEVMRPDTVVDLADLPLAAIEPGADRVRIGALATNTAVAQHPAIVERFPALSQALLSGASPQLRNMATVGGNLMQRTRCPYFRDPATPCNKREPGTGCSAVDGYARSHAVLGTSPSCIAVHPSDMCVALVALDAVVHVHGASGARAIPMAELHTLPGDRPDIESVLAPGDLITHVELFDRPFTARSLYLKVRDRASFAFALASAAVALHVEGGVIRDARVALGGIATRPWRAHEAEHVLTGHALSQEAFRRAAAAALAGARTRPDNAFKVELARRTLARALARAGGVA